MSKFNVGDIVVGNRKASDNYNITINGWVGIVVCVCDDERIRVREFPEPANRSAFEATVFAECFDLRYPTKRRQTNKLYPVSVSTSIMRVIFNKPATIVFWADGTKTVVKCQGKDKFDKEKGLALCIAKKALSNKSNFNNAFKYYIEGDKA